MSLRSTITSVLNIRPGEGAPVALLTLFSFFMGVGSAFFYTSATTLFLHNFATEFLPWVYIASGIAGYVLYAASSQVEKRISQNTLMFGSLLFLIVTVGVFALAANYSSPKVISFGLFVWIRIVSYISAIVFWNLAGRMFDLRQGKRLFGLIGAGEVIGDIIGFSSIPLLLNYFAAKDLLIAAAAALFACLVIFVFVKGRFLLEQTSSPSDNAPSAAEEATHPSSKGTGFGGIFASRYYRLIYLLALLPMFGMYFIDFMFLDLTKTIYANSQVLASFLGIFFGGVAVAEFLVKTFVSGRVIAKYGIRAGLSALPAILGLSMLLSALAGTVYGVGTLFFSLAAFAKLMDRVLRSSLNDPAFQILYQPLPASERLAFQNMIEGVPKAAGNVAAGAILLFFVLVDFHNLTVLSFLFLMLTVFWFRSALHIYKEYRLTLQKSVEQSGKQTHSGSEFEAGVAAKAGDMLSGDSPLRIGKALTAIHKFEPWSVSTAVEIAFKNPNPEARKHVLNIIKTLRLFTALQAVQHCSEHDPETDVRALASQIFEHLAVLKSTPSDAVEMYVHSNDAEERILAAQILGEAGRLKSMRLLQTLVNDLNTSVRRTAILSAGKTRRPEFFPRLTEHLGIPEYSRAALAAIALAGNHIIQELERRFERQGTDRIVRSTIVKSYRYFSDLRANQVLRSKLRHPDTLIRFEALEVLADRGYRADSSEQPYLRRDLEEEIAGMIWVNAALRDLGNDDVLVNVRHALEIELQEKHHRLFVFLSVMYDAAIIRVLREKFKSGSSQERVYALEMLDITVDSEIKDDILPLLEDRSGIDLLRDFQWKHPHESMTAAGRLHDIVMKDFSTVGIWTKSCVLRAAAALGLREFIPLWVAFAEHSHPLISEICVESLRSMAPERLSGLQCFSETQRRTISLFDRVLLLRNTDGLSQVPYSSLIRLAVALNEGAADQESYMRHTSANAQNLWIVAVDGAKRNEQTGGARAKGNVLGSSSRDAGVVAAAAQTTHCLFVEQEIFYGILWEYLPIEELLD